MVALCAGKKDVVLAAPYITACALRKILQRVNDEASLTVITRWTQRDLAMGSSDVECRSIVKDLGGSFRLHPSIHAKYYRGGAAVLIGSANITRTALGWSQQANTEILCAPGDDFDSVSFETRLFDRSREVGDAEFAYWCKVQQTEVGSVNSEIADWGSTLAGWWPRTRDVANLERAYHGRREEIASPDEQRAAEADIECLQVPLGLETAEFRAWVATALLSAPFTQTVMEVADLDEAEAVGRVAAEWEANITDARRGCEAVQSWLMSLVPDALRTEESTGGRSVDED